MTRISELCEVTAEQSLVCVLIEVESLVAARTTSLSNGEPSDVIRTVNAMLTALDRPRQHPNVLLLTTTNISVAESSGPVEDGEGSGGGSVLDDDF
jgi:AAA+ superfamily predicted ATPase